MKPSTCWNVARRVCARSYASAHWQAAASYSDESDLNESVDTIL